MIYFEIAISKILKEKRRIIPLIYNLKKKTPCRKIYLKAKLEESQNLENNICIKIN